jgi:hypothetical protein
VAGERSIPNDTVLPALAELFPAEGAPQFISTALHEITGRAIAAEAFGVPYVRYRPAKSCVVLWSHEDGAGARLIASGRLFHDDRAGKLVARETNRELIQRTATLSKSASVPYRYVPEQRLLLQLFPLDLRLPELVLAADPAWLGEQFSTNGSRPSANTITATLVSYKPWRRCVYRYDVGPDGERRSYYAKVFRDNRGAALLRWHAAASDALTNAGAPWSIPSAVRYIPEAHMLLFQAVDGATKVRSLLRPALKDAHAKAALLAHMSAAAEGLGAFQRAQIDGLPSETPRQLIANFRRDSAGIEAVAPELAHAVSNALQRLETAAGALSPEPLLPTHGAFRHDQLLHADGRLIVLDLDTICLSGASADAGNFLGYLDLTAVRRPRLQPVIDDCARAFVETLRASGLTSPEWLAWYRAAAHVKKALRAFFSLEPNWPETATHLFLLSSETLREARAA